ncbi:hypothetical protein [Alkalimarinus alittae]|uniref:Uncharacterized protein n=1 Tax=Alkalimarinus alittae TaxID=2961619 RepID=A0ABY6N1W8_9ALTE|nr:hypothetical protein [Alkalimarinus alittae]UZE96096.1 hypothetical protein NKI27_18935 [Alkalimarinus alittae]
MPAEVTTLSMTVTIVCIIAACLSLLASYQLMKPLPAKVSAKSTARPLTGLLLLASAVSWSLLGINADNTLLQGSDSLASIKIIESLPSSAAGIAPTFEEIQVSDSALAEARAITAAEEIAEEPKSPDFQKLRSHVTQLLFNSDEFNSSEDTVLIDLSHDRHKDMIKYLADERPGLLTVIYHKQQDTGSKMIVYFPEIAGNQLIYTPLTGPSSRSLSKAEAQSSSN